VFEYDIEYHHFKSNKKYLSTIDIYLALSSPTKTHPRVLYIIHIFHLKAFEIIDLFIEFMLIHLDYDYIIKQTYKP